MTRTSLKSLVIGAGLALTAASAASAHAQLLTASPAPNSAGVAPKQIRLTFSEALEPKFSGFELDMADGMKMSVSVSSDLADAKVLVGTVKAPLMAGVYRVQWRAVSRDTHRTTGAFTFKVR